MAGLGLNFGIVIGAMAGQAALIIATHYGGRASWFRLLLSFQSPLPCCSGGLARILNQAKGREMVTSMIMGFFKTAYQLVFLVLVGTVIPMKNPVPMLVRGSEEDC